MKRTPLKKASVAPKLKLRKKADKLWSELVRLRAKGCCEVCGRRGRTEAHHLWTRELYHMRHDPENGVALCFTHHTGSPQESAHQNPENFRDWLIRKRGQKWYDGMKASSMLNVKPDYQMAILLLEQELKKIKEREANGQ